MGTCSSNHVDEASIDREALVALQANTINPRDGNCQFTTAFRDSRISDQAIEWKDLQEYEIGRTALQLKCGPLERSSQIDSKFPGMSLCLGPFYNVSRTMIYQGSIRDARPHGWGEAVTKSGLYYIGYFDEGVPNYFGKYLCTDGTMYEGGLYKTTKDGYGKLTLPNGAVQEGEWKFNSLFYSNTPRKRPQNPQKERDFDDVDTIASFGTFGLGRLVCQPPIGDFSPPLESFRRTPKLNMDNRAIKSEPQIRIVSQSGSSNLKSCLKANSQPHREHPKSITFAHPLEQPRS